MNSIGKNAKQIEHTAQLTSANEDHHIDAVGAEGVKRARILFQDAQGKITDGKLDFDLSQCGGVLPNIGDEILDSGVVVGNNRSAPGNRTIWRVARRVFNAKDNGAWVALIVEERQLANDSEGYALV